jgi:hypothetical protein
MYFLCCAAASWIVFSISSLNRPQECSEIESQVCALPVACPQCQQKDCPHLQVTWLHPPFYQHHIGVREGSIPQRDSPFPPACCT